jgi:hypothetical protein
MQRLILAIALLALLLGPSPAFAHDRVWEPEIPKGVVGADGIACEYTSHYQGHRYTGTTYIGADAGMMSSDPGREQRWQEAECRYTAEKAVVGYFTYAEGMSVTADMLNIVVTIRRV